MSFRPGNSFVPPSDLPPLTDADREVIRRFTELIWRRWTHGRPGGEGTLTIGWFGHLAMKCPLDLWNYQEILVETRPDLIIECGTHLGGSGLFLAHVCELLGTGRVVTVDLDAQPSRPIHPLLEYVVGSSVDPQIADMIRARAHGVRVMLILDSDHTAAHVSAELAAYADLVTPGCYLVVEDTVISGNPLMPEFGPGPMDAVEAFLQHRSDFVVDLARERFLLTLNPRGYLRRV